MSRSFDVLAQMIFDRLVAQLQLRPRRVAPSRARAPFLSGSGRGPHSHDRQVPDLLPTVLHLLLQSLQVGHFGLGAGFARPAYRSPRVVGALANSGWRVSLIAAAGRAVKGPTSGAYSGDAKRAWKIIIRVPGLGNKSGWAEYFLVRDSDRMARWQPF
jgi:hypothetical protein